MTMIRLTKIVPSRRKAVEFNWIRGDFMVMSQGYREVRSSCGTPMDSCFWCHHEIEDGEMMSLGNPKGKTNVILCHDCAEMALRDGGEG